MPTFLNRQKPILILPLSIRFVEEKPAAVWRLLATFSFFEKRTRYPISRRFDQGTRQRRPPWSKGGFVVVISEDSACFFGPIFALSKGLPDPDSVEIARDRETSTEQYLQRSDLMAARNLAKIHVL